MSYKSNPIKFYQEEFFKRNFNSEDFMKAVKSLSKNILETYESYCISPAYHQFTGRKGSWLYSNSQSVVVVSLHPNIKNKLLIFPEISNDKNYSLTIEILNSLKNENLQLSRFTEEQKENLLYAIKNSNYADILLKVLPEQVLDWHYPIHVLNTNDVIVRKGGAFEQLRQRLRKLDANLLSSANFDLKEHRQGIMDLLDSWAEDYNHEGYSIDDLKLPTVKLFEILDEQPDNFSGQVIFINNKIVSYCICEIPFIDNFPANELSVACSHKIQGLAEWQKVLMCEKLYSEGINTLNVGGSETHGLDRYKRKFGPVKSIPLHSLEIYR